MPSFLRKKTDLNLGEKNCEEQMSKLITSFGPKSKKTNSTTADLVDILVTFSHFEGVHRSS